ncbi:MAG: hypothetical protein HY270_03600 [Deltaproteobacteria bacterium]|nr:hypothetical protein [Deltaproteobacteria bacterium]
MHDSPGLPRQAATLGGLDDTGPGSIRCRNAPVRCGHFSQMIEGDLQLSSTTSTGRLTAACEWLARRPPRVWRILAVGLLTVLSLLALFGAGAVVDGVRYFWLDDDQMISMRYGRNLARGYGLVWNPGEYVEGYSNFLWTLCMAAVHLLPIAAAHTAVAVEIINWALAAAILILSERLLRVFLPVPGLAAPALLLALAVDVDLVYWSAHGFETTLVTAVFLLVIVRVLEEWHSGRQRVGTYALLGLLPLIRSDALQIWATAALLAVGLSNDLRRSARLLGLSLLPAAAHLLTRHWYYGEWLPNTYYLKVAGVPGRTALGFDYLLRFAGNYCVPLVLALVGAWRSDNKAQRLLLAGSLVGAAYILIVGEDLFPYSRFLAHLVPVVLVLAAVGATEITRRATIPQALLFVTLVVWVSFAVGAASPDRLNDDNGEPEHGTVTGILINRHTDPAATIAVVAAGTVSYFADRYALDMLGKSDKHIARETAHPGGFVGHNKFDPEYSLGHAPDLVVPFWVDKLVVDPFAIEAARKGGDEFIAAIVSSPTFVREYRSNPVPVPYLLEYNSVYIRNTSPELAHRAQWQEPHLR